MTPKRKVRIRAWIAQLKQCGCPACRVRIAEAQRDLRS